MRRLRTAMTLAALVLAVWAVWVLEGARAGIDITDLRVGPTPVTRMTDGSGGPPVVIAHGFAGSRQMMQGYALTLAQAGYTVYTFDFEGHGRHPQPMRGDVGAIDGTTRLLMAQVQEVIGAARQGDMPVALLGHSMATDILVRVAAEAEGTGPVVLLSAFSKAITADHPEDMLLITGAWEPGLTGFARDALRMVEPDVRMGETVTGGGVRRKAMLAPAAEHVAILHSRVGRAAALDWLNGYYEIETDGAVPPTGWALLALLAAITVLFVPVAGLAKRQVTEGGRLRAGGLAIVTLGPAVVAPVVAVALQVTVLPVLVANYLMVHLALYGVIQGALLVWLKGWPARPAPLAAGLLAGWAILVFGLALDRYGANFWPTSGRLGIIAVLCVGAIPFMLADSWLAMGAPLWQRVVARLVFLGSLGLAVALDYEGLFFLMMIAPVIVLFYLTFGVMGRATAKASGAVSAGLGLGLALAWALGVSFPLFSA